MLDVNLHTCCAHFCFAQSSSKYSLLATFCNEHVSHRHSQVLLYSRLHNSLQQAAHSNVFIQKPVTSSLYKSSLSAEKVLLPVLRTICIAVQFFVPDNKQNILHHTLISSCARSAEHMSQGFDCKNAAALQNAQICSLTVAILYAERSQ